MARLYCLCETATEAEMAAKPPNQPIAWEKAEAFSLPTRMVMDVCGASQVIVQGKDVRRHYPNVDVYVCPNCHARVVHEG